MRPLAHRVSAGDLDESSEPVSALLEQGSSTGHATSEGIGVESLPEQGQSADHTTLGRFKVGDQLGALLDAHDLARIFDCSLQTIYTWSKQGALRRFELRRPIGAKRWSGKLVQDYAAGSVGSGGPVARRVVGKRALADGSAIVNSSCRQRIDASTVK